MKTSEHPADCFLCEQSFAYGQGRYDGRPVPGWGVSICSRCEDRGHDGLMPHQHPRLLAHFADQGITPRRSEDGFILIPPRGSTRP